MKTDMPGYQLRDYVLLIGLPLQLKEEILMIKRQFASAYDAPQALQQPSILLASFSSHLLAEQKIRTRLGQIAANLKSIKIEMHGFGSFPAHTIYVNITSRLQVTGLVKEIRKAQSLLKPDKDHKPYFIDEACLPVCKKLRPWQYEKAWLEYAHHDFTGRFIADHMLLLRKEDEGFSQVAKLSFNGVKEEISQGNLF